MKSAAILANLALTARALLAPTLARLAALAVSALLARLISGTASATRRRLATTSAPVSVVLVRHVALQKKGPPR